MAGRQTTWAPIETHAEGRYILLCDKNYNRSDGNMEVGIWFEGDDGENACFWSCGGSNGGTEITCGDRDGGRYTTVYGHHYAFTHWMDLPDDPE
jgi:hypothetical protein